MLEVRNVPCASCPYRRDVPSGVWDPSEYAKLLAYDRDTASQPPATFLCHQADGQMCAGWVGCHGHELLALRLAVAMGDADPDVMEYESPVPLFASGAEAAEHGMREIEQPDERARRFITVYGRRRA